MALDGGQIGTWDWDLQSNAVRWGGHAYRVFDLEPAAFPARSRICSISCIPRTGRRCQRR